MYQLQKQQDQKDLDVGNADIVLQTEPVREDQEVQAILVDNLEQNEENVDIIPPAPVRSAHLSLHVDDAPQGASENSVTRSSQVRTHDIAGNIQHPTSGWKYCQWKKTNAAKDIHNQQKRFI